MLYHPQARSKTRSSRKIWEPQRISFPRFSAPSFPFCTVPKTENSELKTTIKFRAFPTPSFPFCTTPKAENSELKTSEFSLRHYDQLTPWFSNSEFSILYHILKRKTQNFLQGLPEQRFFTKLCNLIKFRVFPTPRFRFSATVYPKQKTRRWKTLEFDQTALEKLPGFHLRAFRFERSVKWKTRSWKTSGLIRGDENASGKFTKVFISEFSVLGIVQNGKLGGEIRGSEISQNSDHAIIITLPLAIKIKP